MSDTRLRDTVTETINEKAAEHEALSDGNLKKARAFRRLIRIKFHSRAAR